MSNVQPSVFLSEVAQQPAALLDLVRFYRADGDALLKEWAQRARQAGRVHFAGMGTSCVAPEMVLAALASDGVDASCYDAGELLHYPRPLRGLQVLISQSGESIETRKLAEAVSDSKNLVAITNDEQSALARSAGLVLPMLAGHETAISNKTYSNTLAVLYLMAESLPADQSSGVQALNRLERLAQILPAKASEEIERAASLIADADAVHFIARGPAIAAAKQAALTFMEGTRASAVAFTGGGFRHGPFELVDDRHRCVFFLPDGPTFALLEAMALEAAAKGSHVVAITGRKVALPQETCAVLETPAVEEELFCLSCATTQAFLLEAVARQRGVRAGEFRYGQKITTSE